MNNIILLILLVSCILDIKSYIVFTPFNIFILIMGLFKHIATSYNFLDVILGISIIPIILMIINHIKEDSIGNGDIELLSALGFYFGYKYLVVILFMASLTNFLFSLVYPKEKYPFVPFITLGTFLVVIYSLPH